MSGTFENLDALIRQDADAEQYFYELPGYVREHIKTRAHNVNSMESLQNYAENLLRGDD